MNPQKVLKVKVTAAAVKIVRQTIYVSYRNLSLSLVKSQTSYNQIQKNFISQAIQAEIKPENPTKFGKLEG